jgi:predicted DNA-binding transcriptional regulator YafY
MRRTDRLYALVDELRVRAPRPVSRADLARHLEVTPRTVERDISALQQAGVPIWSQRGRGGGYAIDPRWSLPPLNFDATEALAVIAALTAARSMPYAQAGRRAAQKVLAAMTSGEAARAKELAGRLRLGTFGSSGARDIVTAVEQAVERRSTVRLDYRDRQGAITRRLVEAHGLQLDTNGTYLLGWCRMREAPRAFRLDRIVAVADTGEVAPRRRIDGLLGWADDAVPPDVSHTPRDTENDTGTDAGEPGAGRDMPTRTRRGGAPRKTENRTGANPAFAAAIARRLQGVEEASRRGVTTFAVGGTTFLGVDDDDDAVLVRRPTGEDHNLVLRTIGRDELRAAIEEAWAALAPEAAVTAHERAAAKRAELAPITFDDIRRVILELPGAAEGPIWGQDLGFLIGTEKKTRFARFGPPEAGRVGNLLPPDDENTLVILHCEQRPELLAASPDRFFSTPHYGGPGEPGGVIVRLAEHRGPDDLAELAELLEDAWRSVATPDLIAQLDDR